ncbi:hypothetical protein ACQKQC_21980 [Vibrio fortis]
MRRMSGLSITTGPTMTIIVIKLLYIYVYKKRRQKLALSRNAGTA